MVLGSKYADLKQFPNKWSFGRKSETSRPPILLQKSIGGLEVSEFLPELYLFGNSYISAYVLRAKDHNKNFPDLEVGGQAPATPTPHVVWVVL